MHFCIQVAWAANLYLPLHFFSYFLCACVGAYKQACYVLLSYLGLWRVLVIFQFTLIEASFWQMTSAIAIEDVRREVKILSALTGCMNIVQFFDAFEDEEHVYIVME